MRAVELALVHRLLRQQTVHPRDHFYNPLLQRSFRNQAKLPLGIAQHPIGVALETAQFMPSRCQVPVAPATAPHFAVLSHTAEGAPERP